VVIVGFITYGSRDYLVRSGANYLLRSTNVHVDSAEVRSVSIRGLEFDRVYVDLGNEDALVALNVRLPLFAPSAGGSPVTIERLVVVSGSSNPPAIADGLFAFLSIPLEVPYLDLSIEKLHLTDLPEISAIRLGVSNRQLTLDLRMAEYSASIISASTKDGEFRIEGVVSNDRSEKLATLDVIVKSVSGNAHIDAKAKYRFPALLPVMRSLGVIPNSLEAFAGVIEADHRFTIPIDAGEPFEILGETAPQTGMQLTYGIDGSPPFVARSMAIGITDFALTYPSMAWRVAIDETQFTADWDDLTNVMISLESARCKSGITCAFDIRADVPHLAADGLEVNDIHLRGPFEMKIEEHKTTANSAALTITAGRLTAGSVRAVDAAVRFETPVLLAMIDDHWQIEANAASVNFPKVQVADSIVFVAKPLLSQMHYRSNPEQGRVTVNFDGVLTQLSFGGYSSRVPDITAHIHLEDGAITSKIGVVTLDDSLSVELELLIPEDAEQYELRLDSLFADFGIASASSWLLNRNLPGDLVDGTVNLSGRLSVNTSGEVDGSMSVDGGDLSGYFNDYVFSGIEVTGPVFVGDPLAHSEDEIALSGDLLDIGIPITDIFSSFSVDPKGGTIQFSALGASLLGGRIDVEPFTYSANNTVHNFVVVLEAVPLDALINQIDMPTLSASGSVSGQIPVTVSGRQVSIDSGYIASDQAGGIVRYSPGDSTLQDVVPDSQLGTVTRALSNFVYEDLTSSIAYSNEGDLEARMTLRGTNPDLDPLQPIVLNLSLQNNIPDFLRSMRASRSIEELLERQLNR
jgi:hypothetical protein